MVVEEHAVEEIEAHPSILHRLVAPYAVLRGNRAFDLIFAGQAASLLADWLYIVSLIVMAYDVTKSATFVALLTFVRLLPYAVFLPFTGHLADRGNRRLLLLGSNLGRGVCVLGLLFIDSKGTIWLAFPLVFAITTLASFFRPSLQSSVPAVVAPDDLVRANTLLSQVESVSFVLGPGLGGVFILLGIPRVAFVVTGAAYIISALTLSFVRLPPRAEEQRPTEGAWLAQTLAGYRFLFRENQGVLAAFMLTIAVTGVLSGAFWTLILVLAVKAFHLGGQGTGFMNTANGIGGLIGGMLVGVLIARFRLNQLFVAGAAVNFLAVACVGLSPFSAGAFIAFAIFGTSDVIAQVAGVTVIQTATPSELLGRVFGAYESTLISAMLIGTLAAGPLISLLTVRGATVALSILSFIVLAISFPRLRHLEQVLGVRIFLREVPVLTTLSLQVLDDLACRLREETFPPETEIVRQGDVGDRLYIVKSGHVDVTYESDGRPRVHLATLSTMEYFGEIALLRDVQRTATVRARDTVETYSLMREDFQDILQRSRELELAMSGTGEARLSDTRSKIVLRR